MGMMTRHARQIVPCLLLACCLAAGCERGPGTAPAPDAGGTFTFDELREDLEATGFTEVAVLRRDEGMDSVVRARKSP